MKFTVGVSYTAIATIEIDVLAVEEGVVLPDPSAVVDMFRRRVPELLGAAKQQLVHVGSVIINENEEIVVD